MDGTDIMGAGDYDRRITIRRATKTNVGGAPQTVWASYLTNVPASATPISDGERSRAGQAEAQNSMRFRFWWSPEGATINAKDLVEFDGVIFDIGHVKEIGRRKEIEITAASRAD